MGKIKKAEINDFVKVLTPDEHLVSMKILEINHAKCTVLLGKPQTKITALEIGESILFNRWHKTKI